MLVTTALAVVGWRTCCACGQPPRGWDPWRPRAAADRPSEAAQEAAAWMPCGPEGGLSPAQPWVSLPSRYPHSHSSAPQQQGSATLSSRGPPAVWASPGHVPSHIPSCYAPRPSSPQPTQGGSLSTCGHRVRARHGNSVCVHQATGTGLAGEGCHLFRHPPALI